MMSLAYGYTVFVGGGWLVEGGRATAQWDRGVSIDYFNSLCLVSST